MARSTHDLIFFGAIDAFSEKGYSDTTMDEIAERAGVVKGTLYYNFKSKDALFIYVMTRGVEKLTTLLDTVLKSSENKDDKWQQIIAAQLDFFEENRSFFRLLMQNVWGPSLSSHISPQELLSTYFKKLDQALTADQEQLRIDPDLDTQTISGAIFGMITIPAFRAVLHEQKVNEPKHVKAITQIVLRSLQRRG